MRTEWRAIQQYGKSILKKLLPPLNLTVAEIARQEHNVKDLYNWRDAAKQQEIPLPRKKSSADDWAADADLSVVIKMAALLIP